MNYNFFFFVRCNCIYYDKFEEFFLPRVRSASLSVPFSNDSFMVVDSYEFMCMPKSTGDGTVVQYRIEE